MQRTLIFSKVDLSNNPIRHNQFKEWPTTFNIQRVNRNSFNFSIPNRSKFPFKVKGFF